MMRLKQWMGRGAAVLAVGALAGCQTYGESAALGGLIGAAAGTIIGHQSGHELEGMAIGAAAGAAVGAIAKDQEVRREYEREMEYQAQLPPSPPPPDTVSAETLVLENITVLPSTVRHGEILEVSMQYGVYNARDGVQLKETRTLYKDGREVEAFSSTVIYRANGSWVSGQQFRVANRLEPGFYEIVQTVESRNAMISGRANFRIE